jgi:hypothetical protein
MRHKLSEIILIFAIIITVVIFVNAGFSYGGSWNFFADTVGFKYFYQMDNPFFGSETASIIKNRFLSFFGKNLIRVWTKREAKDELGRSMQIEKHTSLGLSIKGYDYYSHSISLKEINCKEKTARDLSEADYDMSGKELGKSESPYASWRSIEPQSVDDRLYNEVCLSF